MHLTLALVVDRTADRCTVRLLDKPDVRTVGCSVPFRPRATSLGPGRLVAVDLAAAPPVVVWRWFPATVLAVGEGRVRLAEPHHGVVEAAAVDPAPAVGDVVHVTTALSDGRRIDAPAGAPERARAALPDVAAVYARTDRA
jgi:hypothetical protein